MESATMTDRTLEIDGMTGDACVQKVSDVLKSVQGVETRSVTVGAATIAADQTGCYEACAAIGRAGYKAREGARTQEAERPIRATPLASSAQRGGGEPGTPGPIPARDHAREAGSGLTKPVERPIGTAPAIPVGTKN